jgi:ribonuclease G
MVALENGGYLVIENTEAMTVIDVNTGSFIGNNNLEETVFAVNLKAAREIARQVRLRNIGGIVVVDFIDMAEEEHKLAVTQELTKYLEQGKAKCNVLPMNELCITQFTRKRLGNETFLSLVKACPHCGGIGDKESDVFVIMRLRDAILNTFAEGYQVAIVDLNDGIMQKILYEKFFAKEVRTCWKDKQIYFIPHRTYAEEYFTVRGEKSKPILPEKARKL